MALALYRKYRPRTFAEVIGQEHVTEPLSQALRSGRLHHAYLFSGPRGCGKTSSARILARSLNCERGPTPEPCGVCESCRALAPDGSGSIDVIEIDAASHGGVDDARELRERAFFAPASSRFKIYVIDEAHMVSTQGFNALLKLVEEPPDYVKFIFATTEPDKVLGTIKSRTHHYPFRLIPPGILRPYLEQLAEAEKVKVEPPVFPLVVRAGGGSARDTLSVLDQLIAGAGPEGVSYGRAVALLGVTDAALIDEMCDALAASDGAAAYGTIDRVAEAGHDPRRFASDLLERLRDLIVMQQVPEAAAKGLIDGPADQLERMNAQAQRLGPATLSRCADIVHNGLIEMRGTTAPRLLLELITARMLLPTADRAESDLLQRLERMEHRLALGGDQGFASEEPSDSRPAVLAGRGPGAARQPGTAGEAAPADRGATDPASTDGDPPAGGGLAAARAAASRGAAAARAAASGGATGARAAQGGIAESGGGAAAARAAAGGGADVGGGAAAARAAAGGGTDADAAWHRAGGGAAAAGGRAGAGGGADAGAEADAAWHGVGGGAAAAGGGADEARSGSSAEARGGVDAAWPVAGGEAGVAHAAGGSSFAAARDDVAGGGPDEARSGGGSGRAAADRTGGSARRTEIVPDDQMASGDGDQRPPSDARAPDNRPGRPQPHGTDADESSSNGYDERPRRVPPQAVMADPATPEPVIPEAGGPDALDAAAVRRVWDEIVAMARRDNKRIAALASEATVRDIDGDTLVLTFRHSFHARTLAENREPLSDAIYEVLGSRWQIRCELAGDERATGSGAGPAPARPSGGREPSGDSSAAGGRAPGRERGARERSSSARGESGASGDRSSDEDHPAGSATRSAPATAGTARADRGPDPARPSDGERPRVERSPVATAEGEASPAARATPAQAEQQSDRAATAPAGRADFAAATAHSDERAADRPASGRPPTASPAPDVKDTDGHGLATSPTPDAREAGGRTTSAPASPVRQPGASASRADRPTADRRPPARPAAPAPPPATDEEEDWPETALPGGVAADSEWPETAIASPPTQTAAAAVAAPVAVAAAPAPVQTRPTPPAGGGGGAAAAARAAARAAAGRGNKTTTTAPPAPQTKAADADWAAEPPFDPDYDTPGKAARFEGFDPGDEPTDDVIDEKTARQSSEQQAFALLHEALGAERIGEIDLK
ncbi:DNA polymerase III subunit gamma and tau [Asanoa sp. NPDC049518]|uniref:DNA polymerase III subunit gamma and tau n=1 Tax=unclassified Asanoa TaxID=2685164 RepID=UPI00341F27F9